MNDPRLALRLYVIILIVAVMFSDRWAAVRSYLAEARKKATEKSGQQTSGTANEDRGAAGRGVGGSW